MSIENGDMPAFPGEGDPYFESNDGNRRLRSEYGIAIEPYTGLTKRELLAAMAMQGLLANPHVWEELHRNEIADRAAEQADFLLAELAKKQETA